MPRGRPKGSGKKDPFADLPGEFKERVESASIEDLRKIIAEVAMDQIALEQAKALDEDLKQKQEQAKEAGAIYSDGGKLNKLKHRLCRRVLEDRGVLAPVTLKDAIQDIEESQS